MASTLNDLGDEDFDLSEISLLSLPEEPVRNWDLAARGRKTAVDACAVMVAIFTDLNSGEERERGGL
ncbi:hypothetical protein QW71_36150 [Paenibacillus sp. IHB B 3415]|nr:hypothetical protein QW71_36150 [Paenibacillus sp. IHB B 3415]